jgi:predicted alpha/beta-fold hydrolase
LIDANAFRPAPWLPGKHLQTIVPSLWVGPAVDGVPERHVVEVSSDSAVGLDVNRPPGQPAGTLVLIHGMCGDSESAYMRRTARAGLSRGWVTVRMNLRNCGGTEHLSSTLYNAGQSGDLGKVLDYLHANTFPRPFAAAGFSLGGNIALLYAGRAGGDCLADRVAAVNPPIDLEACARAIEAPPNRAYQAYYVIRLRRQLARIARVRPSVWPARAGKRPRSVREFDRVYTAPDAGYASAEEYYARSSAAPTLGRLRRPALLLSALDDPFVPPRMFAPHRDVPGLHVVQPNHGGHCGYWQAGRPRFWAAEAILQFADSGGGR